MRLVRLREQFEQEALPLAGRVLAMARHLTRNATDAEDLVQDTFLRAFERFGQFQQGTNLLAWLNRIAYTQFVNGYHREGRRKERELSGNEQAAASGLAWRELSASTITPEMREGMEQGVTRALDKLPSVLREVLLLCVIGEMKYHEAADATGVPIGTVMSRLFRARQQMRKLLAEVGIHAPSSAPDHSSVASTEVET